MNDAIFPARLTRCPEDRESEPFIHGHWHQDLSVRRSRIPGKNTVLCVYLGLVHLLLLVLLGLAWSERPGLTSAVPTGGRTWSPVQHLVEYDISNEHATDHNIYSQYSGPPTRENEEAWIRLINPIYFNATRDELERAGESMVNVVKLTGGGYLATIGVYHELHCLRQLRFWLYREHYYPNLTDSQFRYSHRHLDHCLETLRLTIMCHGNTALYSFNWNKPTEYRPATQSSSRSVCVKWASIHDWALSRKTSTTPSLVRLSDVEDPSRGREQR
ncbi:hypothetical protein XA68_15382 [Ophiocordyceps unilateralis]|uniref:Tat pathway signal sequence n=1 Tax=Ophiocordyceps unilateralis TaxID=268505 RepID=A0A2A9P8I3_OPHUN|nr:hypothetical protein XA68_15382 [Ophiocordyceps unilateralis]